jgi:hypothetical protein
MGRSLARQRKLFREHFLLFIIEREGKAGLEGERSEVRALGKTD